MSDSNFSAAGGEIIDLTNGGEYSNFIGRLGLNYFYSPAWELGFQGSFAYAQSDDGQYQRENSEVTDLSLLTRYFSEFSSFDFAAEFALDYPINEITQTTDEVLTSDAVVRLRPGLWSMMKWQVLSPYVFVGLDYRLDGRSGLLPYRFGLDGRVNDLLWGAELNGFETIIDDEETENQSLRTTVTNRVNGGSLKYYAVNPSVLAVNGHVGWDLGGTDFRLFVEQSINGKNYANGLSVILAMQMSWDDNPLVDTRPVKKAPEFKVEGENYDESLFEEQKQKTKAKPKPKPAPPPPAPPKVDVDKMLNETQKSLEN